MYEILLADPQVFSESAENLLYFQGWKTDVPGPVEVIHVIGEPAPAAVLINLTVEDVFVTQPAGKYSQFYVSPMTLWWSGAGANTGFMGLAGAMVGQGEGLPLTPENLEQSIQTTFQNFSLVSPGSYSWELTIGVNGRRTDSGLLERFITTLAIPFKLEILAENEIFANPAALHIPHIKGELPLPGQDFEIITGTDFQISIPAYFELTGGNVVPSTITPTHQRYTGSGRQTLTVKAKADFDLYEGNIYTSYFEIQTIGFANSGRFRDIFSGQIKGYLFDAHSFIVDPEALEFFSIKGVESAAAKELEVIATQAFVVQHPFWLTVSPLAGGYFQKLSVTPINSFNLIPGDYHGMIKLISGSAEIEVPVYLKVVESIDVAFSKNALNFTHDNLEWSYLYSDNTAERASVVLGVSSYDFKGFPEQTEHPFKVTFFKAKAAIHLGEIIARTFKKLSSPAAIGYRHIILENEDPVLFKIFPYYRPSNVEAAFAIEERSTGVISENKDFSGIQFVSGRKPKQFQDDYGILSYDAVPLRVTSRSQMLFNFVRRFLNHDIRIYKNDNLYKTVTHSPGNNSLFGLAMFFKDFLPGDVISVRLYNTEESYFEQKYMMIPDQEHSNHIAYIDEYNVLQCFEFTGAFEFSSNYSSLNMKPYRNLVEHIENLESKKEQTLSINTGWIFKNNISMVDAILRAKKVWLLQDGREISLTCRDKEISEEDSQRDLYAYDVEFTINRDNDLQVYND